MPPKNFLETASSKKKFESYKQGSRRNSTSNLTSNIPNPEGKYIGPAERNRLLKEKEEEEQRKLKIDKMIEDTREEFPPLEGSSKPQSPQPKSQQQHEIQNEQRPKQQQPQPQPDISNSQNSYSNVVCNQKNVVVNKIFRLKIVPPFRKEHFENKNALETEIAKAYAEILKPFKPQVRMYITISRTFEEKWGKRLHILHVTAPEEAEEDIENIKTKGLQIMGRTVFPTGDDFYQVRNSQFPRKVWVKINNLPFLCSDEVLLSLLDLPEGVEISENVTRETIQTENGTIHNGKAKLSVVVPDSEKLKELKQWSLEKSHICVTKWFEIPIYMSTPSLHKCDACEKENRKSYIGHDIAWCRVLRKPEKTEEAPESCQEETADESQAEQENEVWADAPTKSFPNTNKKNKKRSKSKSKESTSPGLMQQNKFQLLSTSSDQPEAILSATSTIQIQPPNPKNPQHPETPCEAPLERSDHG